MRIAILGPVWKSVPPEKYGGTEAVVSFLTEELVRRGHEVTLFASGDSVTGAKLKSIFPKNLYTTLGRFDWTNISYGLLHSRACFLEAEHFDIIHNHLGPEALLFARFVQTPVLTTLHSSVAPDFPELARALKDERFVSISSAQRTNAPYLNWVATVYHGMPTEQFSLNTAPKGYLLFMGTLSPEKGVDVAVRAAKKTGMPLVIAGEERPEHAEFLAREVFPHIDGESVSRVGEAGFAEKVGLYQNAKALLFPVRWNEAFGLVMVEAMLCGTPVIAFANGSTPEVVDDGVTGFVVPSGDEDGLADAVRQAEKLDRLQSGRRRSLTAARCAPVPRNGSMCPVWRRTTNRSTKN